MHQLPNLWDWQLAAPPTGTGAIENVDDVSSASEETVVT